MVHDGECCRRCVRSAISEQPTLLIPEQTGNCTSLVVNRYVLPVITCQLVMGLRGCVKETTSLAFISYPVLPRASTASTLNGFDGFSVVSGLMPRWCSFLHGLDGAAVDVSCR